jgi:nucleotide-binding universal stress UspA family protein
MVAIDRILVPIDFSSYSKEALVYAIPFARKFKGELLLLHVVEPAIYPADFNFGQVGIPSIEDELRTKAEEELNKLVDTETKRRARASTMVRVGKPFIEIITAAREESIDLIIMATHGHSGIEQILFGSTAERVVRKAHCPVLTVRTAEMYEKTKAAERKIGERTRNG